MDANRFQKTALGRLVRINDPKPDFAFIPNPLPLKWDMPAELWPLLMKARESLARLDGVGLHMPNHELILTPLQRREALRSSSLEGTYVTPEELLLYQMDPRKPTSETDPVNASREVFNYSKALDAGVRLLKGGLPVCLRLITDMHRELLKSVRGANRMPGEFRKRQVQIGVDARFIPPPPAEVLASLDLFERYHHESSEIDPLIRAFMAHYQFETIHPFLDGNGRVGRLLLSLTIYHWLELKSPWLYMSSFFEQHKNDYIDRLFNVSAHGDWKSWIDFCLKGVIAQSEDSIRRIHQLVQLRDKYQKKVADSGGSARLQQLVGGLFQSPVINVPRAQKQFGITYPTAKSDINRLVKIKILKEGPPNIYPRYYFAPEILFVAYNDE